LASLLGHGLQTGNLRMHWTNIVYSSLSLEHYCHYYSSLSTRNALHNHTKHIISILYSRLYSPSLFKYAIFSLYFFHTKTSQSRFRPILFLRRSKFPTTIDSIKVSHFKKVIKLFYKDITIEVTIH
jgi:hypothetical protein